MLESEWRKAQEHLTAPGTGHGQLQRAAAPTAPVLGHSEKQRLGKWKWLMDLLLSQGCTSAHSWCPELFLKQKQQEEQGQGVAVVPGKGGQPWFQTPGQSLRLREHWRRWDCAAGKGLWHLLPVELWPGAAPASPLAFISSPADPKERKTARWAVCCLAAQGHAGKGEEGAVLFWAASSSIPRGGILPLECWLLCRKDLKTTYTKMIIKT